VVGWLEIFIRRLRRFFGDPTPQVIKKEESFPTDYTDYTDFFGSFIPAGKGKSKRKVHHFLVNFSEQNINEATFLNEPLTLIYRHHPKIICVICVICGHSLKPNQSEMPQRLPPATIRSAGLPKIICVICG
jgi:hypothetical protein